MATATSTWTTTENTVCAECASDGEPVDGETTHCFWCGVRVFC